MRGSSANLIEQLMEFVNRKFAEMERNFGINQVQGREEEERRRKEEYNFKNKKEKRRRKTNSRTREKKEKGRRKTAQRRNTERML